MTLLTGEVVLIRMRFHQADSSKIRPALVLLDSGDQDFLAAPITSQQRTSDFDLPLQGWRAVGLNVPSTVRLHKLTVLPKPDIVRRLGVCSGEDRTVLADRLCRMFCPSPG
jgi:mRNA interferase MazF